MSQFDYHKESKALIEDDLNTDLIFDDHHRTNSKEILKEISSVALLSPACFSLK